MKIKVNDVNEASWRDMQVKSNLPENLRKLEEIAYNLWWCWDSDARNLFRNIDRTAWKEASSNPIRLATVLPLQKAARTKRGQAVPRTPGLRVQQIPALHEPAFRHPQAFHRLLQHGIRAERSAENIPGGLGVLAGDYLKEASDSHVDMTAIGFLYRYGYFTQSLSMDGQQIAVYEPQNFNTLPIKQVKDENDQPLVVDVPYPGRTVHAYLWKVQVGRIVLYLLDTDNELNSEFDRSITHQLYGAIGKTA